MKYTIPVVTRLQDNGDGGYTMYCYNNKEELIADHPMIDGEEFDSETEREELIESILNEDDPYKNGYIGKDEIEFEIENGVPKLTAPLSFHAGQ